VASGATDAIVSGLLNDEASSSRAALEAVVEAEVAANPAGDGVVAGLVGDAGSATQLAVDARATAAVDAIDHDVEMTAVLSDPASDAKMLLELEYGHASSITVSPDGGLAATDVQSALEELDAEKAPAGHTHAYVQSVQVGTGLTRDNTDPANPVLSATAGNAVVCRVYPTANVDALHNVTKFVSFDAESFDPANMHSLAVNPGRVTITEAGYYLVTAKLAISATSNYASAYVYKNGVVAMTDDQPGNGATGANMRMSDVLYLAAGDYLELAGLQRTGGTVALLGGSGTTYLDVVRIGA
jgi:hypothetical protein